MAIEFRTVPGNWHSGSDDPRVQVTEISLAPLGLRMLFYCCSLQCDYDGSPQAYGPASSPGLDHVGNAFSAAKGWFGAVAYSREERDALEKKGSAKHVRIRLDESPERGKKNKHGVVQFPVIQGPHEPAPGKYVSPTSVIADPSFERWDQRRYRNGMKVPFGVVGGLLGATGVALNDEIISIRPQLGLYVEYRFMDGGPHWKIKPHPATENKPATAGVLAGGLGESSPAVFTALGEDNPKRNGFKVCNLAFPGKSGAPSGMTRASQMRMFATAENADDLPLLMATQLEVGPGASPMTAFRMYKAGSGLGVARPHHFGAIKDALLDLGFDGLGRIRSSWA